MYVCSNLNVLTKHILNVSFVAYIVKINMYINNINFIMHKKILVYNVEILNTLLLNPIKNIVILKVGL